MCLKLIVVNVPAAAGWAPMTAPSMAPPSMFTELPLVLVVPSPGVVLAALASALPNKDMPVAVISVEPNVFAPVV